MVVVQQQQLQDDAERSKKRRWQQRTEDDGCPSTFLETPEIEIQFDSSAMEYTVVATTSRDAIQSVTVIDAVRSEAEYGAAAWVENPTTRQQARTQGRKADSRPLSPKRLNRSSALEDHRNPNFTLERTNSFDNNNTSGSSNKASALYRSKGANNDHRQTLDSAARDQPPNERISLYSSPSAPSPTQLIERKRSLPPRAPPPTQSFGVRVPLFFQRSVTYAGQGSGSKQSQSESTDPVPSRGQFSNTRNKLSPRMAL